MDTFPTLLYWDRGFSGATPRQYYKSYGLTKSGLVQWLQKQISCTKNGANDSMCATSINTDMDESSTTSHQDKEGDRGGKIVISNKPLGWDDRIGYVRMDRL